MEETKKKKIEIALCKISTGLFLSKPVLAEAEREHDERQRESYHYI